MTLVILAAGMGSRYGGLKQLDPVGANGEFIIDYSIYDAVKSGYDKIVFIIKEENYQLFRETVGHRAEKAADVSYVFQKPDSFCGSLCSVTREKPWGTGHALLCAKDAVDTGFAVINADDFYGRSAYGIVREYLCANPADGKRHYCMAGYVLRNTLSARGSVSRGLCRVDKAGMLLSVAEHRKLTPYGKDARSALPDGSIADVPGDTLVSMNFYGFDTAFFDSLQQQFENFLRRPGIDFSKDEFGLTDAVSRTVESGIADLRVLPTYDTWFGVTYAEDKPYVRERIAEMRRAGVYPDSLIK